MRGRARPRGSPRLTRAAIGCTSRRSPPSEPITRHRDAVSARSSDTSSAAPDRTVSPRSVAQLSPSRRQVSPTRYQRHNPQGTSGQPEPARRGRAPRRNTRRRARHPAQNGTVGDRPPSRALPCPPLLYRLRSSRETNLRSTNSSLTSAAACRCASGSIRARRVDCLPRQALHISAAPPLGEAMYSASGDQRHSRSTTRRCPRTGELSKRRVRRLMNHGRRSPSSRLPTAAAAVRLTGRLVGEVRASPTPTHTARCR